MVSLKKGHIMMHILMMFFKLVLLADVAMLGILAFAYLASIIRDRPSPDGRVQAMRDFEAIYYRGRSV